MTAILIVIGNVGRDPEIKQTQNGEPYARFSVAVNKWKSGEKTTMWVPVLVFDVKKVELIQQHVHKGSKLFLEGELEIRTYQAQDGTEKQATELIVGRFGGQMQLLDRKGDDPHPGGGERRAGAGANGGYGRRGDPVPGLDDEIPF